ncbi:MAG: hypothetical protein QME81_10525 [bacterium]|nr:hypothetical protein [bacterium]
MSKAKEEGDILLDYSQGGFHGILLPRKGIVHRFGKKCLTRLGVVVAELALP